MDSIGQIFSGVGSALPGVGGDSGSAGGWLSKILPYFLGGSAIAGTVGNISANAARNKVLSSELSQMNALNNLTPAQITAGITGLEQPLSNNLVNSVGNSVQAQLASRGLSQAPGIYAQALAQGLAPYQLQEQQLAQQAYFQKLGLPIQARPSPFGPFPQQTNTSQLWQALLNRFMGNNNNLSFGPAGVTTGPTPEQASPPGFLGDTTGTTNTDFWDLINNSGGLAVAA